MQRVGSRAQVMHGNAKFTSGGLTKKHLTYNNAGKIVSIKASKTAKKLNNLVKAGYTTTPGKFGAVRIMKGGDSKTLEYIIREYIEKLNNDVKEITVYRDTEKFNPVIDDYINGRYTVKWGDGKVYVSLTYIEQMKQGSKQGSIRIGYVRADDSYKGFTVNSIIPHLIDTLDYDNMTEIDLPDITNNKALCSYLRGILKSNTKDLQLKIIGFIDNNMIAKTIDLNKLTRVTGPCNRECKNNRNIQGTVSQGPVIEYDGKYFQINGDESCSIKIIKTKATGEEAAGWRAREEARAVALAEASGGGGEYEYCTIYYTGIIEKLKVMTNKNLEKTKIMIISEYNAMIHPYSNIIENKNIEPTTGTYTYSERSTNDTLIWHNSVKNKNIQLNKSDDLFNLDGKYIEEDSNRDYKIVINMYDASTSNIHKDFATPYNRALRTSKRFPIPGGKAESNRRGQQAISNKKKRNKQSCQQ